MYQAATARMSRDFFSGKNEWEKIGWNPNRFFLWSTTQLREVTMEEKKIRDHKAKFLGASFCDIING